MSPNELASAENGNFFVRERVRRILELVAPGQCSYLPTCFKGTTELTPWHLVIPFHQVISGKVDPSIPRCMECGEPRSAHPGTQWTEFLLRINTTDDSWTCELDHDIAKSATWSSSERGWNKWMSRDLFVSVRLLQLLKRVQAKGFYERTCQKTVEADVVESVWIQENIELLRKNGIPFHADGTLSDQDAKWFREYLKSQSHKGKLQWDIRAVERRIKAKLPMSYVEFINRLGAISFENVDDVLGFKVSILSPNELGLAGRSGILADEVSKSVNGLVFATTGNGDFFCFDVQRGKKEFSVLLFKHEYNVLEPYADNFAACIKRFVNDSGV